MAYAPIGGPNPRDDHDFAPAGGVSARLVAANPSQPEEPRRRRISNRSVIPAIVLVAVWGEILLDATVRTLVLGLGIAIGCTLGLMAAAMALGLLGFGLLALFDRATAWMTRATQWPDE